MIDHKGEREFLDSCKLPVNSMYTPLVIAIYRGKLEVCEYLIEFVDDSYIQRDNIQQTIFILERCFLWSIDRGDLKMCKWIISLDIIYPSHNHSWAFIFSSALGKLEVCKWLITFEGVDPAANCNEAFRKAAMNGHLDVVKWLITVNGVNPAANDNEAFRLAAIHGYLEVCKWLITLERVVLASANYDEAFRLAAVNGRLEVCEYLITMKLVDPTLVESWEKAINF